MKAYKGFRKTADGRIMCINMEYKPGKTYKHEGKIKLCESGFHACHELYQVWLFYPNDGENVFYEVECGGDIIESDRYDGKLVCSEIKLVKEIDMSHIQTFDDAYNFSDGFAVIQLDDKWNFINTDGRLLSDQWFDDAFWFSEGFAVVELDSKKNLVNTEGCLLCKLWFDYVGHFSDGFSRVRLDGKYNFINTDGELLSHQWFDVAWSFSEGFAKVYLNDKQNFINTEGCLLSEQWFDRAWYFSNGFAYVRLNGELKRINQKGEIV